MSQHWQDREVRELLIIRGEEEVQHQVSGTVRDTMIYKNITSMLNERGFDRTPRQVINKLKALKKKYLSIKDSNNRSGMGRLDWPFYELCDNIYGNSALANPVRLSSSMARSSADSPPSPDLSIPAAEDEDRDQASEVETASTTTTPAPEADSEPEEERPQTSRQQTNGPARRRKRTRLDQTSSILSTAMADLREMDKAAAAREDARMQMFMEHERKLWESQERLLREDRENQRMLFEMLLSRLPVQTQPPQPRHHAYDSSSFYQSGPAYSSTPTKHDGETTYRHL